MNYEELRREVEERYQQNLEILSDIRNKITTMFTLLGVQVILLIIQILALVIRIKLR